MVFKKIPPFKKLETFTIGYQTYVVLNETNDKTLIKQLLKLQLDNLLILDNINELYIEDISSLFDNYIFIVICEQFK